MDKTDQKEARSVQGDNAGQEMNHSPDEKPKNQNEGHNARKEALGPNTRRNR